VIRFTRELNSFQAFYPGNGTRERNIKYIYFPVFSRYREKEDMSAENVYRLEPPKPNTPEYRKSYLGGLGAERGDHGGRTQYSIG
jgi:hypothetical protein